MTMWCGTLRGDDIQQAISELKSQRAAIRVRYDREMKQLETKIADLETLEHVVVSFVSNYKVEDGSPPTVADPGPTLENFAGEIASEQGRSTNSETIVARPNLTLLNSSVNSSAVSEDNSSAVSEDNSSAVSENNSSAVSEDNSRAGSKDASSRIWTPTERALRALKHT
jgi:hypothetical protein